MAKERVTTAVVAEVVPFTFLKSSGEKVRAAPLVHIPFVDEKMWELLDQNKRYTLYLAPHTRVPLLDPFLCLCITITVLTV